MRIGKLLLGAISIMLLLSACAFTQKNDGVTIGLSLSSLNGSFFVQMRDGAQKAADNAGVTLQVQDANDDAFLQADQMDNFLVQDVDAILIAAVDSDSGGAVVNRIDEDIPIVALDRGLTDADPTSVVSSDNVKGGELGAEALATAMDGKGDAGQLQGTAGTSSSRERGAGFDKGIQKYPDIEVVAKQPADFDRATGLDTTENMIQGNPEISGIFAENDLMALGAVVALGNKAGDAVDVIGFDGTPDGLKAIREGKLYATVAQTPEKIGQRAVEAALTALQGGSPPEEIKIPVQVVTQDNLDDFIKANPGAMGD